MFVGISWFHLHTEICKFRFPNCSTFTTITIFIEAKKKGRNFAINVYLRKQSLPFQVALKIRPLDSITYK